MCALEIEKMLVQLQLEVFIWWFIKIILEQFYLINIKCITIICLCIICTQFLSACSYSTHIWPLCYYLLLVIVIEYRTSYLTFLRHLFTYPRPKAAQRVSVLSLDIWDKKVTILLSCILAIYTQNSKELIVIECNADLIKIGSTMNVTKFFM